MKQKLILIIILIMLILFGIFTYNVDKKRIEENQKPIFAFEAPIYLNYGDVVSYYGLGYKVYRYTKISPKEPYEANRKLKIGSWFMRKGITNVKNIKYIELYNGSSSVGYKYILNKNNLMFISWDKSNNQKKNKQISKKETKKIIKILNNYVYYQIIYDIEPCKNNDGCHGKIITIKFDKEEYHYYIENDKYDYGKLFNELEEYFKEIK